LPDHRAKQSASCAETIKINDEVDDKKASSTISTTIQAPSNSVTLESFLITAGLEILNSPQATETLGAAPAPVSGHMGLTLGGAVAGAVAAVAALQQFVSFLFGIFMKPERNYDTNVCFGLTSYGVFQHRQPINIEARSISLSHLL
jgi:hypothetical protein